MRLGRKRRVALQHREPALRVGAAPRPPVTEPLPPVVGQHHAGAVVWRGTPPRRRWRPPAGSRMHDIASLLGGDQSSTSAQTPSSPTSTVRRRSPSNPRRGLASKARTAAAATSRDPVGEQAEGRVATRPHYWRWSHDRRSRISCPPRRQAPKAPARRPRTRPGRPATAARRDPPGRAAASPAPPVASPLPRRRCRRREPPAVPSHRPGPAAASRTWRLRQGHQDPRYISHD